MLLLKHKKKSQSLWNLVNVIASWGNNFHQVSSGLEKNYGFFINAQFLNVCGFIILRLYVKFILFYIVPVPVISNEFCRFNKRSNLKSQEPPFDGAFEKTLIQSAMKSQTLSCHLPTYRLLIINTTSSKHKQWSRKNN